MAGFPTFESIFLGAESQTEREDREYAERYAQTVGGLARAVQRVTHIEGGPCVPTAPQHEEFLSAEDIELATCPLCASVAALVDGDLGQGEPDPLAAKLVGQLPVHGPTGFSGVTPCGLAITVVTHAGGETVHYVTRVGPSGSTWREQVDTQGVSCFSCLSHHAMYRP